MTIQATTNAISTFIFRVPQRVYCPACGMGITQRTVLIHHDILWCLRCGPNLLESADWLGVASCWSALAHQWTHVRGLRAWTPEDPLDGIVTHYLKLREESRKTIRFHPHYSNLTPPEDVIA